MQRAHDNEQVWPQEIDQDQLAAASDVDFTKFLELGNDFSQFEAIEQQNVPSALDTPMGRLTFSQDGQILSPQQQVMLQEMAMGIDTMPQQMIYQHLQQSQHHQNGQYQQFPVYQQMQNPYPTQVPPTPVSNEMHAAKYAQVLDAAGQMVFDRQNASFTPLVSPAQTPLEHAWGMPDYLVGEEFFSPLTSPAIEAQQQVGSTNATSSPVDLDPDQGVSASKRPRRKLNPTSRASSIRSLRTTQIVKPAGRRRQGSVSSPQTDRPPQPFSKHKQLLPDIRQFAITTSEDSLSPEPYLEHSMRPPPLPQQRTPTALRPQTRAQNAPATPAMLMSMPGKTLESPGHQVSLANPLESMEDISLPAAAKELPARLPGLNVQIPHDEEDDFDTPTGSAKTPKLSANSTPRSSGMKFTNNSSELSSKPSRGSRSNKKRQSISQVTVSPALRPKISPSISPMIPSSGRISSFI